MKFEIEGMDKLIKDIKKLGEVPQKHVTAASKKAMNIVKKEAKANAPGGPETTGNLKKGIIMKGEKSRYKSKKVYRILFDPAMNDVFQKPVKNPGESGSGRGRRIAYYPASQEYGFFARNGRYIPGFKFTHNALAGNTRNIEKIIVTEMKKKIDQEISKAGLK